jgi:hypothetical protein
MHFARRWFPPSIVSGVFEPLVADWQRQWNDATPAQRRWINAKGFAAFATTTAMMTPRLILAPSSFSARPLVVAGGFWLLMSFILLIPFLRQNGPLDLVWLLLPSCLTAMLPFAMLPALDAIRREGEVATPRERRAVITLAGLAVCGVVLGQWVTPVANQTFRNEAMSRMNGRPSIAWKGVRERTTLDLIAGDAVSWEDEPMHVLASSGQLMAFEHDGFWQPMDTLRDRNYLEELCSAGKAPWMTWRS